MTDACVLVTGGSGFIGTWVLRELLSRGAGAVVVDTQPAPKRWRRVLGERSAEVKWADVSLTDRDGLQSVIEEFGITHVIHLAALLPKGVSGDPTAVPARTSRACDGAR